MTQWPASLTVLQAFTLSISALTFARTFQDKARYLVQLGVEFVEIRVRIPICVRVVVDNMLEVVQD
jgi:hypothetical protein